MTRFSLHVLFVLAALLAGCGESEKHTIVRIEIFTYEIPPTTTENCDDSTPGSIVGGVMGGYLFGTGGAVIGAIIGANQGECKKVQIPARRQTGQIVYLDDSKCFISRHSFWKVGEKVRGSIPRQEVCSCPTCQK